MLHSLTPAEIAAYIGAAAWVPHLVGWVYQWIIRPKMTIIPEKLLELGFTVYGPIFNIRLAIDSSRKDAIIDGLEVTLRHTDGDSHVFSWTGLRETFSEITDTSGNRQLVEKDSPAIALKVTTGILGKSSSAFNKLLSMNNIVHCLMIWRST